MPVCIYHPPRPYLGPTCKSSPESRKDPSFPKHLNWGLSCKVDQRQVSKILSKEDWWLLVKPHCCTLSLCNLGAETSQIITEIPMSITKIIWWASQTSQTTLSAANNVPKLFSQIRRYKEMCFEKSRFCVFGYLDADLGNFWMFGCSIGLQWKVSIIC